MSFPLFLFFITKSEKIKTETFFVIGLSWRKVYNNIEYGILAKNERNKIGLCMSNP